ncbi:Hypothetical predicted protein [Olea europaea subsp. europaea]|uniref:Uncharacterized protein n=1 Tax=Olea europaea subsp. europaea TaxID=158383 RepID=A0A8S0S1A1_OLEEU|nr:Hypothetical predicted protein [Olea europaea subsp. europaea]
MCAGHVRDAARFLGISWQFLGLSVQAMFGTRCASHPNFHVFLDNFLDTVCRQCPGLVGAAVGIQHDFQVLLGEQFLDMVFRPCPGRGNSGKFLGTMYRARSGRVLAVVGTQPDFQAFIGHVRDASWPWQGRSLIFRQLLEHGVHAVFGTRLGHGRDAAWFPRIFRQFLGHGVWAMSRMLSCLGCIMAKARTESIFMQFWAVSRTRCGSHVQDVAGTHLDFHVFLGNFWNTMCRQSSGRIWSAVGMQPGF